MGHYLVYHFTTLTAHQTDDRCELVPVKLPKDYEDLKSFQPCTSPSPTATEGEGGGRES